jgi:predicted nucleic acid-binding protein
VTRYLLDTNIVCEALKPQPSAAIASWLQAQSDADLFLATLTVAEIWRGVLTAPIGRRQQELERWFLGPLGPQALFRNRILAFDENAAIEWGRIVAEGRRAGQPRSPLGMLIAATAAAMHRCNRERAALSGGRCVPQPTKHDPAVVLMGRAAMRQGKGPPPNSRTRSGFAPC